MVDGVVTFLLDKISSFLQDEVKLSGGLRGDVAFIKNELAVMNAFLRAVDHAHAMEEKSDSVLKIHVKQLRDVAYDTEDVLDEFMLSLAHTEYMLSLAHNHGHGCHGFPYKTYYCMKNMKARHLLASAIEDIKRRVKDIAESHQRYRDMMSSSEQGSSSNVDSTTWYDSRGDALLLEEAELVGIDKPKHQVIEWLIKGDFGAKVVSVVGMGGSGKTTLIKKVYDDARVKKHFESHIWLNVSESCKMEELLKDLIHQLFNERREPIPQGIETMNADRLKGIVNQFLQQRRYIAVFDDVWKIDTWNAVKLALPTNNFGSRVMLTTRSSDIASISCIETEDNMFEVKPLSEEDSWILFCRKAFRGTSCPQHLEEISRSILKRCGGLPLAIVTVGVVLATKNTIDEWEMLLRSLGDELESNDRLKSMEKLLSLSFNDLPYNLKICWLYLSIFPEDHEIEYMRLIRLWIAEGFVQERPGKTLEEVAEIYLNELINRSVIQVAATTLDGRLKRCRVHDLLREIIISKSREYDMVTIANGRDTKWPPKVRRVAFHSSLENIQESECFNRLRSFIIFGDVELLPKSSMSTFLRGRLLKVLDLRGAPLETVPDEVFKLFHLRYLSLRGTKVRALPKLIGKLHKLETLDLKDTDVTELPNEILRLHRLRHLLLYSYKMEAYYSIHYLFGFKAPSGMGGLHCLQKLCHIEANQTTGSNNNSVVKEVGRLTQLRRLGIMKLRKEDGMDLCSSIEKLTNLRTLTITSIGEDEILDLQYSSFSTPRFIQHLILEGRLERVPRWIPFLHSLTCVYLRWSGLIDDDPLHSLQGLPILEEILLLQAYDGEGLCFKAGGFKKLKKLFFERLKGLRWVTVEEGALPLLEELTFRNCKLMDNWPSGIEHLTKLQKLEFSDMPHKLTMMLQNRDKEGEDYRKTLPPIPKVWVSYSKNGSFIGEFV